jgi:hypothetical protein
MSDQALNFSGTIKYVLRGERTVLVELSSLVENFHLAVITNKTSGWEDIISADGSIEKGMAVYGTAERGGDAIVATTVRRGELVPAV